VNDHYARKEQQQHHGVADKRYFSRFIFFSSSERAYAYTTNRKKKKKKRSRTKTISELESQSDNNNDALFKDERDRETENKKRRTRLNAPADDPGKKSSLLGRTFARPREAYLFYSY